MSEAVSQLRTAAQDLVREGRAEGIEADGPLGLWLEAQAAGLKGLAAILEGQSDRFEQTVRKVEAAGQAEIAKLGKAIEAAGETVKQGELAIRQARNAQLSATVQQENAVQRMIKETLPMFADSLKGALVIREARWNRRKQRAGFALSGAAFLVVFCAGYGLSTWLDRDRLQAIDQCIAAPIPSGGHVYCRIDGVAGTAAPTSNQPGASR